MATDTRPIYGTLVFLGILAARLSASESPVRWALAAARRHPERLTVWKGRIETWRGERRGDTTEVFVYPSAWTCHEEPIVLRFVGSGNAPKVLEASSLCLSG